MRRLHSASRFSSGGTSFLLSLPMRSVMHACRIRSMIIFSLNSSPISRMLPSVASFTCDAEVDARRGEVSATLQQI